jgi:release factor glutamine methyltransferase
MRGHDAISLLRQATARLKKACLPSPQLDAEVLMAFVCGVERADLYLRPLLTVSAPKASRFVKLICRRLAGEPVAFLRGFKEFWSLNFRLNRATMIPRPETELVVETALRFIRAKFGERPIQILDVGTGSGNISIALAKEIPQGRITAIDISAKALRAAKMNADSNDVSSSIRFLKRNFLSQRIPGSPFDLLISNPPYVALAQWKTLDLGITAFEPKKALVAGSDGLDFYRRMVEASCDLLKPGGLIISEIGDDQGSVVSKLFGAGGFGNIVISKDAQGLDRVVTARVAHG